MNLKTAKFVVSNQNVKDCPSDKIPEYAFIGRSNVGKSSLINMLTNNKKLAKTSSRPGKTRLINHFIIDSSWHLVDLPGYGYAKASKTEKKEFQKLITDYFNYRKQLINAFILVDVRHEAQKIDIEFMRWLTTNEIAFSVIFTKNSDSNIGVNIATSIDMVLRVANDLKDFGKVRRGKSGIRVRSLTPNERRHSSGAFIHYISKGGAGENAGLSRGDIIVRIGKRSISRATDVSSSFHSFYPGDSVSIQFIRKEKMKNCILIFLP